MGANSNFTTEKLDYFPNKLPKRSKTQTRQFTQANRWLDELQDTQRIQRKSMEAKIARNRVGRLESQQKPYLGAAKPPWPIGKLAQLVLLAPIGELTQPGGEADIASLVSRLGRFKPAYQVFQPPVARANLPKGNFDTKQIGSTPNFALRFPKVL